MNKHFICSKMLAALLSITVIACQDAGTKEESSSTTDSITTETTAAEPAPIPNSVTVAPDIYKLAKDSMGIRMIEATYKPGDSSALHSHHDYAVYTVSGGKAAFTQPDGTREEREMTAGTVRVIASDAHSIKNTGNSSIKVVMVEVDRPSNTITTDAALDATKVAPDLYKSVGDSLGIRTLIATYKPGQSSGLHAHPYQAVYTISGGLAEFTDKDGKKMPIDMKTGEMMLTGPRTHSVKNIGKTTLKVLVVEVSRAEK